MPGSDVLVPSFGQSMRVEDSVQWLEPWYCITDVPSQATGMERELCRELSAGHPLFGLPVRAVGRRQDCDDVLFVLDDGRVAVVHLTWTHNPPEQPPWPGTTMYPSFEAWVAEGMRPDHDDFQA
jgi:hypothetical protein